MNKFWNGVEKILGSGEGEVQHRGPGERLPRTLESICERVENLCCTPENLPVEVDHPQEHLESRFVTRGREGRDGGRVLSKLRITSCVEKVSKKLNLGDSKSKGNPKEPVYPEGGDDGGLLDVL